MNNFKTVPSLEKYLENYQNKLKTPSCLPYCIEDLCSGWTTETYRQILIKLTYNGRLEVACSLWSFSDLSPISNKTNTLKEVFKLFDTRALSRVDTLELVFALSLVCSGPLDKKIDNCFFALVLENGVTKEQLHFFLDTLFRGISKIALVHSDTFYPKQPNLRLSQSAISKAVDSMFQGTKRITSEEFAQWIHSIKPLSECFSLFSQKFQSSQEHFRQQMISRIRLSSYIKQLIHSQILNF